MAYAVGVADVVEGVGIDDHKIGEFALLQRAYVFVHAQIARRVNCCRGERRLQNRKWR